MRPSTAAVPFEQTTSRAMVNVPVERNSNGFWKSTVWVAVALPRMSWPKSAEPEAFR